MILIKSSDFFVKYSEKIGLGLGVPQFIIGVTIVSIGTSLPELITSLFAVTKGDTSFVAGNVIGSNIANILLVVGIATIFAKKIEVTRSLIKLDLPILISCGAILAITMSDGTFNFLEAIVCLTSFVIYLFYNYYQHKESKQEKEDELLKTLKLKKKPPIKWYYLVFILISSITLFYSAQFTIESVISLATILKLDTSIIAVTAVAIGTSLPELSVSIVAAKKGNFDLTLGNIFGSNIFNGFVVMGIPALIHPLHISDKILNVGFYKNLIRG